MKNVILILMLFLTFQGFGQTPYSVFNSVNEKGVSTQQVSLANVWVGSRLSYSVDNDKPLDENFLFSARVIYTPYFTDKFALPVAITVSPDGGSSLAAESGVNFGVYPYYKLINKNGITLLAHGGMAFKSLQDEGQEAIQQFRALAGLEIAITPKTGGPPITISVTPVYTNTSGLLGNKTFMEGTAILPIAKNIGLLADWQSGSTIGSGFRFGVVVNSALK